MRKFQTRVCPLCSKSLKKKELKLNNVLQSTDYFCEEFYLSKPAGTDDDLFDFLEIMGADYTGPYIHESHYSVINSYGNYIQTTIVPPFIMETSEDAGALTKVYRFPKTKNYKQHEMLEIPAIYPEDYLPGRLVEKLKTLILFS